MEKTKYVEPMGYFPEEALKKFGLGPYNKKVYPNGIETEKKQREKENKQLRDYINKKD